MSADCRSVAGRFVDDRDHAAGRLDQRAADDHDGAIDRERPAGQHRRVEGKRRHAGSAARGEQRPGRRVELGDRELPVREADAIEDVAVVDEIGEAVDSPRRHVDPPQPVEGPAVAVPAPGDRRTRVVRERGRAGREHAGRRSGRQDRRGIGVARAGRGNRGEQSRRSGHDGRGAAPPDVASRHSGHAPRRRVLQERAHDARDAPHGRLDLRAAAAGPTSSSTARRAGAMAPRPRGAVRT